MKLSVIIPAYNEERSLPRTLESIMQSLSACECASEVIVVDNESTDSTRHVAENHAARIVNESEHNIAQVRNTGGANSSGDVLIFIDADTTVPRTLFKKIVEAMNDQNCFGGAVAVDYENLKKRTMRLYLGGWKFWSSVLGMAQGAAQFCRRSVFEKLGGYDRTIFVGEDIEFYWRLSRFAKQHKAHLHFINDPKVVTSSRRFNQMSVWRILLLTHPLFIFLAWRKKGFWSDWYRKSIR